MTTDLIPTDNIQAVAKAPFSRLKMKHRRILALHLKGLSSRDIATVMGHEPGYVSSVIRNPAAQIFLEEAYREVDMEIRALTPQMVDVVRRGLCSSDERVRLKAADQAARLNHRYQLSDEEKVTAEDVIERVLEVVGVKGERLRYSERRFLSKSKDDGEIIDVTSVE